MLEVGEKSLFLKDIRKVVHEGQKVSLAKGGLKKVLDSQLFLTRFSKGKLIYGINTGFGPMAQYRIKDADLKSLQFNLIRSHACGVGNLMDDKQVRAIMLARLSSLMKGRSGIGKPLVTLLRDLINHGVYPCIYEHGGVGASGDLVQLAHLSLVLIGEGEVRFNGRIRKTADVFKELKLRPVEIDIREGIAVMNGTSSMTGIGALNVLAAQDLINWCVLLSTTINEIVGSFDDHFSVGLNEAKLHVGQRDIATAMRNITRTSKLIKKRHDVFYKNVEGGASDIMKEKVQEYYSLRCVPQILGPVLDTIREAGKVVMNEMNSVNDNPIVDHQLKDVFHGGNFHGDYVSLEMDKLRLVITKMAMLSERQLNYLLNDRLNEKLPPFLNLGTLGLNYGLQGMQFTATSTVAECQTLSTSSYIHSIPNNKDNQDIVSMGTNSALITCRVIENAYQVLAIHSIAVAQAIDAASCLKGLSASSKKLYKDIRSVCPTIVDDKPHFKSIEKVVAKLKETHLEIIALT